ncbi:hypothetical protein ACFO4O_03420 [Glaciecola siphonariae]|uniref:Uncharacterized protein n=1 Tax=Glaciecola siphonariae TaxID=521012 RepID=A0ABV9LUA1_9ALTE
MNWRNLLNLALLVGASFYLGYFIGNAQTDESKRTPLATKAQVSSSSTPPIAPTNPWLTLKVDPSDKAKANSPILSTNSEQENTELNDEDTPAVSSAFDWDSPGDIIAMFNQLIDMSKPGTEQDVDNFGIAIDQLRLALAQSPTQLAILVEHMQGLSVESREFNYITAILQGLPDNKGHEAMQRVALELSLRGDTGSRQQFLHLVSNTFNAADNSEILSALVDIALYSDASVETQLDALDLLMPFQINTVEREQILGRLEQMLDDENSENKNELANHVLRFSNSEQRESMASKYIGSRNDVELRYSILDGIHSGTVPRTARLKEELLIIATDRSDPLNDQAKHALMYGFDITNQEYQQIKD